jgi:hypothetical protein
MAYSIEVATLRAEVQLRTRRFAETVVAPLARVGVTPNALTVTGLILNVGAGVVLASGEWMIGGALVLIAGAFDMFDGALARVLNQKTDFGAFLDSTLDRYSEVAVLVGLQIGFLQDEGLADYRLTPAHALKGFAWIVRSGGSSDRSGSRLPVWRRCCRRPS